VIVHTTPVYGSQCWSSTSTLIDCPYNQDVLGAGKKVTGWFTENVSNTGTDSIWERIKSINNGSGICNQHDWYVGSPFEYNLAKLLSYGPVESSLDVVQEFFKTGNRVYAWTCYETNNETAWVVTDTKGTSTWKQYSSVNMSLIPLRSF